MQKDYKTDTKSGRKGNLLDLLHFLKKNILFTIGLLLVGFIAVMFLFGPYFCTHDPEALDYSYKLLAPCREFPFGTDPSGRCILCRVIYGGRTSISVALTVVLISGFIGIIIGIISGYAGGAVDMVLMRIVEIMLSFPSLIFTLAVLGTIGNGTTNQIIAMSVVRWASFARFARTETKNIMSSDYMEAAKAMGNSQSRVIFRYIFPNIISNLLVIATLDIGPVLLAGAALSYLGLGAQIPSPEWGLMVNSGKEFIRDAQWITLFPGLATVFTALSFNLLGEGIGDMINPYMREKAVAD